MIYLGWSIIALVVVGLFVLTWKAADDFRVAALAWLLGIVISVVLLIGMKLADGSL
jgi:hypothetical protein